MKLLSMSFFAYIESRKGNNDRGKNKPVISQHLSVSRTVTCHVLSHEVITSNVCNLELQQHADTEQSPGLTRLT